MSETEQKELEFAIELSDFRFEQLQVERKKVRVLIQEAKESEKRIEHLVQELGWLKRGRAALVAVAIAVVVVALGCAILLVAR